MISLHNKTILFSLFLCGIFFCPVVMPMHLKLETVIPLFFKTIENNNTALREKYLQLYPELKDISISTVEPWFLKTIETRNGPVFETYLQVYPELTNISLSSIEPFLLQAIKMSYSDSFEKCLRVYPKLGSYSVAAVAPLFFAMIESNNAALEENNILWVKRCLEFFPDVVYQKNSSNKTPLAQIFNREKPLYFRLLIEKGSCTNLPNGDTMLHASLPYPHTYEVVAKVLLSCGSLCNTVCKHMSGVDKNKTTETAYDEAFAHVCGMEAWNAHMALILAASEFKELFMQRYNKVLTYYPSILPDETFMNSLALGFDNVPLEDKDFWHAFTCPAVAQEFKDILDKKELKDLAELISEKAFSDALVTRNKVILQTLLRRIVLEKSDEHTEKILENFHLALEKHKQYSLSFAEEMQLFEELNNKKRRQSDDFYTRPNKVRDINFRFQ